MLELIGIGLFIIKALFDLGARSSFISAMPGVVTVSNMWFLYPIAVGLMFSSSLRAAVIAVVVTLVIMFVGGMII